MYSHSKQIIKWDLIGGRVKRTFTPPLFHKACPFFSLPLAGAAMPCVPSSVSSTSLLHLWLLPPQSPVHQSQYPGAKCLTSHTHAHTQTHTLWHLDTVNSNTQNEMGTVVWVIIMRCLWQLYESFFLINFFFIVATFNWTSHIHCIFAVWLQLKNIGYHMLQVSRVCRILQVTSHRKMAFTAHKIILWHPLIKEWVISKVESCV